MTTRIKCEVPGCKRTRKCDGSFNEWICSKHWPAVPKDLRKLYNRAKTRLRKGYTEKNWKAVVRFWIRCRNAAIHEALGI